MMGLPKEATKRHFKCLMVKQAAKSNKALPQAKQARKKPPKPKMARDNDITDDEQIDEDLEDLKDLEDSAKECHTKVLAGEDLEQMGCIGHFFEKHKGAPLEEMANEFNQVVTEMIGSKPVQLRNHVLASARSPRAFWMMLPDSTDLHVLHGIDKCMPKLVPTRRVEKENPSANGQSASSARCGATPHHPPNRRA